MNSKDGSDLTWTPNPAPAAGQDVAQPDADATVSSGPDRRQQSGAKGPHFAHQSRPYSLGHWTQ